MDDPDSNGNGYGIYFYGASSRYVYATGICLMALDASGTPARPNDGGLDFDGDGSSDTFQEIAQEAVDWLAFAQVDTGTYEGGWRYAANPPLADNSNSGYAVLGLASAEAFGCTVPEWVRTELNVWIDTIQDPVDGDPNDGGSWYWLRSTYGGVNELKTGNLLFEMTFCGDDPSTQRFQDAMDYIERHWQDANVNPGWGYDSTPAEYQAMYCLMRGLEYSDVDLLDTDGDGERDDAWYNQDPPALSAQDFASVLVEQQLKGGVVDGSWPGDCLRGGSVLCTAWALLTLEYPLPSPSIGKTVTPTTDVAYRDTVTYTVVLSNSGKRDAFGVLLTDTLPSEIDFGSWVVQPSGTSVYSDRITWSGTVPAGEAITFTFTALYVIDPDTVTNTVEFKSTTGTGSDDAVFTVKSIYFTYLPLIKLEDDDYWPKAPSSR